MSRIKSYIALLLALLTLLPLVACGTADDDKDDYIKGQKRRQGAWPDRCGRRYFHTQLQ